MEINFIDQEHCVMKHKDREITINNDGIFIDGRNVFKWTETGQDILMDDFIVRIHKQINILDVSVNDIIRTIETISREFRTLNKRFNKHLDDDHNRRDKTILEHED